MILNIQQNVTGLFNRLENQKHLQAIKNAFVLIIPIIMAGSFAVLLNSFPLPIYQQAMTQVFGPNWSTFGGTIWNGTFSILSLFLVLSISSQLSKSSANIKFITMFVALASFMLLVNPDVRDPNHIGLPGFFIAIFTSIGATELFNLLSTIDFLRVKIPEGEVSELTRISFEHIMPAFLTIAIFSMIKILLGLIGIHDLFLYFYENMQAYTESLGSGISKPLLIVFFNQLSWFFGIHGSSTINLDSVYFVSALEANIASYANGIAPINIATKPFFDAFVYLGGTGATLCMAIAMIVFSKRSYTKKLGFFALAMGLFNINEILILGLPIVLNPLFIIPFISVPLIFAALSYLVMSIGIVPLTISSVNWTSPIFYSGYLATDSFVGSGLQLILLVIGIAIYAPFIKQYDLKKNTDVNNATNLTNKIFSGDFTEKLDESYLRRQDELGTISKALNHTQNLFVNIVNRLKIDIRSLSSQSENLSEFSEALSSNISSIKDSIDISSDNSVSQAHDLKEISQVVMAFNQDVDTMNVSVKNVSEHISEIQTMTDKSNVNMQNMSSSIKNVTTSFDVLDNSICIMSDNMQKIADLTSSIGALSRKTNILAINASIEATNSGEAGKGFAVIAQQIRELSISSDNFLKDIETIIGNIDQDSVEITNATKDMRSNIDRQYEESSLTIESFKNIMAKIITINEKLNDMIQTTTNIDSKKEGILERIQNSSELADNISSSNAQISDYSNEILTSLESFLHSSNELEKMSHEISLEIDKYSV
jgi:PTS system cellobiose-specific IIC component